MRFSARSLSAFSRSSPSGSRAAALVSSDDFLFQADFRRQGSGLLQHASVKIRGEIPSLDRRQRLTCARQIVELPFFHGRFNAHQGDFFEIHAMGIRQISVLPTKYQPDFHAATVLATPNFYLRSHSRHVILTLRLP